MWNRKRYTVGRFFFLIEFKAFFLLPNMLQCVICAGEGTLSIFGRITKLFDGLPIWYPAARIQNINKGRIIWPAGYPVYKTNLETVFHLWMAGKKYDTWAHGFQLFLQWKMNLLSNTLLHRKYADNKKNPMVFNRRWHAITFLIFYLFQNKESIN